MILRMSVPILAAFTVLAPIAYGQVAPTPLLTTRSVGVSHVGAATLQDENRQPGSSRARKGAVVSAVGGVVGGFVGAGIGALVRR